MKTDVEMRKIGILRYFRSFYFIEGYTQQD